MSVKFRSDIRQWKSVAEFRAHLSAHHPSVAWWALGVTLHHTWKPRRQDWRGHVTIELSNTNTVPVRVYAHEGIAQCLFFRGERPVITYADRSGKYQGQQGVTLPRSGE